MSEAGGRKGATGGTAPAAGGERPEIARRVLEYFQRNRDAMDSVEGIARFWVHEEHGVVANCLATLESQGLLVRRTIAGTDFYSLAKESEGAASPAAAQAIRRPAAPLPPAGVSATGAPAPAPPFVPRGSILMVDDDPSVCRFMVEALADDGHEVRSALNGEQAIAMFRSAPADLVVTDVMMPGVSGLELLQQVKSLDPSVEVIVITAHASVETAITALRHGAYDFITKPLADIETLYRVVQRALERRRLTEENRLLVDNLQARNVELKETVARLAAVNEIGKATTGLLNLNDLYESVVRLVAQQLKARRVSVLLSEPETDTMTLAASVGISDPDVQNHRVRIGEGIAGRVAANQKPLLVHDIEKSELKDLRRGGRYATGSFMITPLNVSYPIRYQRRRVGVINVSDKHSGDPFTEQDLEFLSTLSSQVAVAIENARLVKEMEGGYLGALVALIRGIEDARAETRGHSARVAELAAEVAYVMNLSAPRIELLLQAAALHEIGRAAARPEPAVEGRVAAADDDPWTPAVVMAAERILAPIPSLRAAREIILHSADWFDSAAVPFGSARPGIPIESRILGICEELDRLAPAGAADPQQLKDALQAIRKRAGKKHDPEVVAALFRVFERDQAAGGGAA